MRFSYKLVAFVARTLIRWLFGYSVRGLENIPRQGQLLIAANHQSYLDPPLIGSILPREIHYMAKAQLFSKPILGPLIRHLNAIPVNRSGQDLESLRRAVAVLARGGAILVFPEGTRSRTDQFLIPTGGLGLLARQSGASVLPVYIHGTRRSWKSLLKRGAIRVVFGQPLQIPDFDVQFGRGADAYRAFSNYIMGKIAELKARHAT